MCIKGLLYRLSHDCHFDTDCDWCITNLAHGRWVVKLTMLWIETHRPRARLSIHQSLTTTLVKIVHTVDSVNRHHRLMKTCSARSKRRDQYQSYNRETNNILKPLYNCNFEAKSS